MARKRSSTRPYSQLGHTRVSRNGLTLFELILAIALSSFVLLLLAGAIQLHTRALDTKRLQVEQAHLARAILRQVTMELRGTVNTALLTSDDQSAAVTSSMGQLASSGATDPTAGTAVAAGTTGTTTAPGQSSALPLPTAPGLYGTATELHFDTNRGRPLVLSAALDPMLAMTGQPSGPLQRVSYYVGMLPMTGMIGSPTATAAPMINPVAGPMTSALDPTFANAQGGLIRRSVDHAIAEWSLTNADTTADTLAQLMAPEVVAMEFRYFDGLQWWSAWDSQQQGGLPCAIEITLVVSSAWSEDDILSGTAAGNGTGVYGSMSAYSGTGVSLAPGMVVYQTTVTLPAALPATSATASPTASPTSQTPMQN